MAFAHPEENIKKLNLKKGMKVADFGAGAGHYTIAAAHEVGEDGQVYAIEIQKKLVDKIKSEADSAGLTNVDPIWSDLEKPEGSHLDSGVVDAVIISNILFQIKNKTGFMSEAHRVITTGGRLLLVGWSDTHGGIGPPEDHLVSESRARELAEEAGLKQVEIISPGAHHYGLIFQKPE